MKRTFTFIISLGLVLMLAGIPAMAENVTSPTKATSADVSTPVVSFDQAVTLAKSAAPGYELMSLTLEDENGTQVYQAELINPADGTLMKVKIDSTSGQLISDNAADERIGENDNETADEQNGTDDNVEYVGKDDGQEQDANENENEAVDEQNGQVANDTADAALMAKATVTLAQAEATILSANAGAMITSIKLEDENGMPVFSAMLIDTNGQQIEVMVDAVTGSILPGENQSEGN